MANKVTLYIEDTEIKLLITKGKQVDKWASLLLEPSLVRDGVIVDEEQVAESIKNLLKMSKVSANKVTVALSGLNSIFRIITLPEISQSLLQEAVINEARRVIPVPLEQVYISYQMLPSTEGEMRLFLVAYPRNSTDVLIKTMKIAGLRSDAVDLAPLALARCSNEPQAIIINSWLTYIDIIIMTDTLPQVIRSMSLPTEAVAVEEKLPFIAEELARTVAFYNSSNPGNQLDSAVPVLVCGDLAEARDSWKALVGKSAYPVSALTPPVEFPETFDPCKFMVNIGMALRGQLPRGADKYYSIVDINAMPGAHKPVPISVFRILAPIAIVVGIGVLAYGGLLLKDVYDETASINSRVEEFNAEADLLRLQMIPIMEDIDEVEQVIEPLPGQATQMESQIQSMEIIDSKFGNLLASLSQGLEKVDADLNEVTDLMPAAIKVSNVTFDDDAILVNGVASSEYDIFVYARALRNSERFDEVTVSSITELYRTENEVEVEVFEFDFLVK